jgi:hypothetical protein
MKNLMVTISGGRSSAMMSRHIQTNEKYKDYNKAYVFCNTGMERYETIQFLKDCETYWGIHIIKIEGVYSPIMGEGVKYKIVEWDELNMDATPFSECIMHMNKGKYDGMPNQEAPYCSERLKTIPAKKLCDDLFGVNNYIKAIGYRKEDMPKRISWSEIEAEKGKRIFPLLTDFDYPIGQGELNKWWNEQPFKLNIHNKFGNCELCWKKSDNNLIQVIRHGTRFVEWYQRHEKQYGNTSFRNNKSIDDLVKLASLPTTGKLEFDNNEQTDNCVCGF